MARISVDLSESQDRPVLPEGDHVCVVKEIKGPVQGPNAPYLKVTLEVDEDTFNGALVFDNVTLSENAKWKSANFFRALGAPPTQAVSEIDTDEYQGRPVIVRTRNEDFEGTPRPRVAQYKMHDSVKQWVEKTFGATKTAPAAPATATTSSTPKAVAPTGKPVFKL
ncbi:MAG TPA: hypothetical protein VJ044_04100 [Candidatus Hodarchaeales archaeon]|nr:hypothetical protein [Candidatus Hodarchaeales archaeon]